MVLTYILNPSIVFVRLEREKKGSHTRRDRRGGGYLSSLIHEGLINQKPVRANQRAGRGANRSIAFLGAYV